MVDVECQRRVQVAKRVVRQRRQMDHRVESAQILRLDVAHVFRNGLDCRAPIAERAMRIEIGVHADDVVPSLAKQRHHDGTDIPATPGDENSHDALQRGKRLQVVRYHGST